MQNKTQIPGVHNSFASIFTENDVLFGRGRAIEKHPGNRAFRLFVQQYSDEYSEASRAVKSYMLSEILESVKKRGVRMFKCSEGGVWQQADDKEMKLKIGHALRDAGVSMKGSREINTISMSASSYAKLPPTSGIPTMGGMLDSMQPIDAFVPPDLETQAVSTSAPFFSANFDTLELNGPEQQWRAQDESRKATFTGGGGTVAHPEFLASRGGFSNRKIHQQAEKHQARSIPTIEYMPSLHDTDRPPNSIEDTTVMEASSNLFASAHRLTRARANRRYASVEELQKRLAHVDGWHTSHDNNGGTGGLHERAVDSIFDDFGVDGLTCSGVEAIFDDFVNSDSGGEVVNTDTSADTSPSI